MNAVKKFGPRQKCADPGKEGRLPWLGSVKSTTTPRPKGDDDGGDGGVSGGGQRA